jgi:hypothetical protein
MPLLRSSVCLYFVIYSIRDDSKARLFFTPRTSARSIIQRASCLLGGASTNLRSAFEYIERHWSAAFWGNRTIKISAAVRNFQANIFVFRVILCNGSKAACVAGQAK